MINNYWETPQKLMVYVNFVLFASVPQQVQSSQTPWVSHTLRAFHSTSGHDNTDVCTHPHEPTIRKGPPSSDHKWDGWQLFGNYSQGQLDGPPRRFPGDTWGWWGWQPGGLIKWPVWPGVQYGAPHCPLSPADHTQSESSGAASPPQDSDLNHATDQWTIGMGMQYFVVVFFLDNARILF